MIMGSCAPEREGEVCVRQSTGKWLLLRSELELDARGVGPLADGRIAYLRGMTDDDVSPDPEPDPRAHSAKGAPGDSDDAPLRHLHIATLDAAGHERALAAITLPRGLEVARVESPIEEDVDHALHLVIEAGSQLFAVGWQPGKGPAQVQALGRPGAARIHAGRGLSLSDDHLLVSPDGGDTWSEALVPARVRASFGEAWRASATPSPSARWARGSSTISASAGARRRPRPRRGSPPSPRRRSSIGSALRRRPPIACSRARRRAPPRARGRPRDDADQGALRERAAPQRHAARDERVVERARGHARHHRAPRRRGPRQARLFAGELDAALVRSDRDRRQAAQPHAIDRPRGVVPRDHLGRQPALRRGLGGARLFALHAGGSYLLIRSGASGDRQLAEVGQELLPMSDVVFSADRSDTIAWMHESDLIVWIAGEAPRRVAQVAAHAGRWLGQPTRDAVPVILGGPDWAITRACRSRRSTSSAARALRPPCSPRSTAGHRR